MSNREFYIGYTGTAAPSYKLVITNEDDSESIVRNSVGEDNTPDAKLSAGSDTASLSNGDVGLYGDLSEDNIADKYEQNIAVVSSYKNLAADVIKKLKQIIFNLHNKGNSGTIDPDDENDNPSNPGSDPSVDPDNPSTPSTPDPTSSDTVDPTVDNDPADEADGSGPKEQLKSNKSIAKGGAASNITIGTDETVITLENPFGGTNYQYKISSTNGAETNAKFEFIKNGRLAITGDNMKIVACDNQKDDIIVMGDNNEIDTGNGDDIVRVGFVLDQPTYKLSKQSGTYLMSEDGTKYFATDGNIINTGTGNDHVLMWGTNYKVDMGSNLDKFLMISNIATGDGGTVINAEDVRMGKELQKNFDRIDGWSTQGTDGDCRLLAIINSFCRNTNLGSISNLCDIQVSGSNYVVTFPNYPDSSKNSITVSKSEVTKYSGVYGDLDTIIFDYALNKLISKNKDFNAIYNQKAKLSSSNVDTSVEYATYNTIAKYLTGSSDITFLYTEWNDENGEIGKATTSRLIELWNMYNSNEISNLGINFINKNNSLGIVGGHAYSIKNLDADSESIELVNPWNDADVLKLTFNDMMSAGIGIVVYGKDIYNQGLLVPNGSTVYSINSQSDLIMNMVTQKVTNHVEELTQGEEIPIVNPFEKLREIVQGEEGTSLEEIKEIEEKIAQAKSIIANKKSSVEFFS